MTSGYRILLLAGLLSATTAFAAEPENFYYSQQKLNDYYQSGQYMADISTVMQQAQTTLQEAVARHKNNTKLAIVLDVDETSLSNIKLILESYDLVYQVGDSVPNYYFQDFGRPYEDPAIFSTLALYQYAIKNNVDVFFLTGRYEAGRKGTEDNLRKAGFTQWKELIMRQQDQTTVPAVDFKTQVRKRIVEQGYDIVLNIGDQQSDLTGGYADYAYKVPNPYYYVK